MVDLLQVIAEAEVTTGELRAAVSDGKDLLRKINLERDRGNRDEVLADCQSFEGFVRRAWKVLEPGTDLVWGWHMTAMCDHLEAITFGKMYPRLIINVPPGMSKSMIVSTMWQAYEWGPCGLRHNKFLSTSFGLDTVKRDTRKTRDLIMSEWFQDFWPTASSPQAPPLRRAGELSFENYETGTREGTAFSSITSKRGDRFTIDDPHSIDGAESDADRVKATRRFLEGGLNRLNDQKRSAIVVVMQRLHMDDLTGVLLARDLGFEHLMLPMKFEPSRSRTTCIGFSDPRKKEGELLDKRRFPDDEVAKLAQFDYSFAGQYQQRPAPREGGLFKVDKIETVEFCPPGGESVRGWDLAASKGEKSPYTVGLKLTQVGPLFYVEDVRRDRWSTFEVEQQIETAAEADGISTLQSIPQDPGSAGVAQKNQIAGKLAGHNFRFSTEQSIGGAKEQRAIPPSSSVDAGLFRMVRGPWNDAFIEELRNFPNASFKDQVDALSRAYAELIKRTGDDVGEAPTVPDAHDRSGQGLEYEDDGAEQDPFLA